MFSDSSTANHFCQSIASPCCDDAPLRRQNNDRIVVQKSMTRYYTVKMVSNETTIVKYSLKLMHSIYNSYFRDNLYIVTSFAGIKVEGCLGCCHLAAQVPSDGKMHDNNKASYITVGKIIYRRLRRAAP